MNENQTPEPKTVRPTKKQRELLTFIEEFIGQHGYSPSYREIMSGLNYTSVATVALHVNNLIKRGHLRKRDFNARSLEVVNPDEAKTVTSNQVNEGDEKWLVGNVEHRFAQAESASVIEKTEIEALRTLVEALRVLGIAGAAQSFVTRLHELETKAANLAPKES
jgi:repressor LexA